MFVELCKEYISNNKSLIILYLIISSLSHIIKVIVTPLIYSNIMDLNTNHFTKTIKNVAILWCFVGVFYIVKTRMENNLFPNFMSFLRQKLLKMFLEKNKINFDDSNVSSDVTRILELTRYMKDVFSWILQYAIPVFILTISINIYFFYKIPLLGLVNLLCNTTFITYIYKQYHILVKNSNQREGQYMKMVDKLDENFNNLFNIYLNNQVDNTIESNKKIEVEYNETYKKQNQEVLTFTNTIKFINYFFAFISLYILYKHNSQNDADKSKEFIQIILIFTFYISTLESLSEDITWLIMTIGNIENAEPFLKAISHVNLTTHNSDIKGDILFDKISFYYKDNSNSIFKDFTLNIKQGKRIGILGKTGSGKSTLMKLLLGFYKLKSGHIYIDGKDLYDLNIDIVRENINYINQKTTLFNDTILNNMKYGNDTTDHQIIQLLKKYNLLRVFHPDGNNDENSLQILVKTNGSNISMGMQKVIFLIRGILKPCKIFIFDEPFSSIDQQTRDSILNLINQETLGKTVIIITHDMNHLDEILDQIIEL